MIEQKVTTFRPDTTFPYLKVAREYERPYDEVLNLVERLDEFGRGPEHLLRYMAPWQLAATVAWHKERDRRAAVR